MSIISCTTASWRGSTSTLRRGWKLIWKMAGLIFCLFKFRSSNTPGKSTSIWRPARGSMEDLGPSRGNSSGLFMRMVWKVWIGLKRHFRFRSIKNEMRVFSESNSVNAQQVTRVRDKWDWDKRDKPGFDMSTLVGSRNAFLYAEVGSCTGRNAGSDRGSTKGRQEPLRARAWGQHSDPKVWGYIMYEVPCRISYFIYPI